MPQKPVPIEPCCVERTQEHQRIKASSNQARYVKAELSGTGTYMIPLGHMVEGRFDEAAFKSAADALVRRHDALRTCFEVSDGAVYAVVSQDPKYQYHFAEMTDQSLPAFRQWALPRVFDQVDPLHPGTLIRFLVVDMGNCWRFTIAAHHAITDGFSRGVMNKELLKLYAGETLPPVQSYYTYATDTLLADDLDPAARSLVQALPNPVRLVGDGVETADVTSAGQVVLRSFEQQQKPLRTMGKSIGATQFGVLTAAYALGLRGFSGSDTVSSFFQTEGRKAFGASSSVVGPFSNTLPLDLSIDLDQSFAAFACALSDQTRETVALEKAPVLDLTLVEGKAPSVSINMFPPAGRLSVGSLDIGPREFLDRRTEYDLNLVWSTDHGTLNARAFYNASQISQTRADLFLDLQSRLLDAAIEAPHLSCRQLLAKARAHNEAITPLQTRAPEPQHRLHQPFFDWAERTPNATALTTSRKTVTYDELATHARRITGGLRKAGVTEQDRVVIFSARHPDTVAAMLGVSASGASFALIDATYPTARIQRMLDQIAPRYVIETGTALPEELMQTVVRVTPLPKAETIPEIVSGPPRDAAYYLFTSGTTGHPKLCTHPDKTVQRFVAWQNRTLDLAKPITTIMMSGLAHDPMLRDVLLPLSHGGSIAIPSPCEMADPEALRCLVEQAQCNIARFGPSSVRLLTAGMPPNATFGTLKAIFWGGERVPQKLLTEWRLLAPNARQFNVFGTTETPQAFLVHEMSEADAEFRDVPLGVALPYAGVRLVDADGSPVSIGEVGEIVADLADPVGGVDPGSIAPSSGVYLHFTGDKGYQLPDGTVFFIGRQDNQFKINGFRVELGEVEAVCEAIAGVTRACAVLSDGQLLLFAMVKGADTTEKTIRASLFRKLPGYMLPAQIVPLTTFPTTANGKIDKEAMVAKARHVDAVEPITPSAHPTGETENTIAAIFAKHAGRGRVTRDQSLFDLGADSLSTIEARLDLEATGMTLPDNWQWMPISELAKNHASELPGKSASVALSNSSRVETFVLIRCLAIIEIVAFHTGFSLTGGMSIVLFVLAGYSFGRLQLPAVTQDDHAGRVWALLARLMVPLVPITLFYLSFTAGFKLQFDFQQNLSSLFLFRNLDELINVVFLQNQLPPGKFLWLWFLHVYLQMFLVIAILLCIPTVRHHISATPWRSLLLFFLVTEVVSVGTVFALSSGPVEFSEVARMLHRSPTTILPFLTIGALVAVAKTHQQQAMSFALVLFHFAVVSIFYEHHSELWWIAALSICTVFPYVSLPRRVSRVVATIAASSLMIYLLHTAAANVFSQFAGRSEAARIMNIVFQILCGVALSMAMRPVLVWLGVNQIAEKNITFGLKPRREKKA